MDVVDLNIHNIHTYVYAQYYPHHLQNVWETIPTLLSSFKILHSIHTYYSRIHPYITPSIFAFHHHHLLLLLSLTHLNPYRINKKPAPFSGSIFVEACKARVSTIRFYLTPPFMYIHILKLYTYIYFFFLFLFNGSSIFKTFMTWSQCIYSIQ